MKKQQYIKHREPAAKAPKKLKLQTFQKIERINLARELLGFYASVPATFLNVEEDDKK